MAQWINSTTVEYSSVDSETLFLTDTKMEAMLENGETHIMEFACTTSIQDLLNNRIE
jgi:hypothetical protein